MSQNLTQPEEIDRILMAMAGCDMKAGASIPDEVPLSGNLRDAERSEFAMGADFPYGTAPTKSMA